MKKNKTLWILIILLSIAAIAISVTVYYNHNNQEHVILSNKFYISIKKDINITHFENKNMNFAYFEYNDQDEMPYCYAALKVNDEEYKKILNDMKKASYLICEDDDWYLEEQGNWMNLENIAQTYTMDTSKAFLLGRYRIHCVIFITNPENGFRDIYLLRN